MSAISDSDFAPRNNNPLQPRTSLAIPEQIDTPRLVIDLARLKQNIAEMAEFAQERGISLVPHFKTHKTIEIAKLQAEAGAEALCVAKLSEAEILNKHGFNNCSATMRIPDRRQLEFPVF